ncbi:thioredoxin family protein [Alteromonas sp. ASW11-130]|uniref:thioredoxin family protein n=1 Tax=Alteromonas sp. ASW11-130 TaxID=3015775 RepID=UPI00224199C1|nr:thioredoxin family protein [Alteromonas sp. ASW11-130]MCW8090239.1 thioredoxin family protein [Alteromonas sp. ASW11-130]
MPLKHLCISIFFIVSIFSLSSRAETADGPFYEHHANLLEKYQSVLAQARKEDTLILLIVGADWCHDSKALAGQIKSRSAQSVISKHYTLMAVDAGWLNNLSDLLSPLGHPVYFGTPSVFIIDPEHQIILNRESLQRWQSAHSESDSSFAHYLSTENMNAADKKKKILERNKQYRKALARIQEFERQQAKKLYEAYSILGPKLAVESETGHAQNLDKLWDEVRRYRYQLQHDLAVLYQSLGKDKFVIPSYPKLSFE